VLVCGVLRGDFRVGMCDCWAAGGGHWLAVGWPLGCIADSEAGVSWIYFYGDGPPYTLDQRAFILSAADSAVRMEEPALGTATASQMATARRRPEDCLSTSDGHRMNNGKPPPTTITARHTHRDSPNASGTNPAPLPLFPTTQASVGGRPGRPGRPGRLRQVRPSPGAGPT
jgi:hypothetical protein